MSSLIQASSSILRAFKSTKKEIKGEEVKEVYSTRMDQFLFLAVLMEMLSQSIQEAHSHMEDLFGLLQNDWSFAQTNFHLIQKWLGIKK
jgi:DNA-binding MarR family transcriptional regulator